MWFLLGILFLGNGIVFLIREIRFIIKQKDIIIISYMRLLFSLTYGFIPSIMCFLYVLDGTEIKLQTLVKVSYSSVGLSNLYFFWMLSIFAYIFLCVGYSKNIKIKRIKPKKHMELSQLQISFVAFTTLIIGFISLYLWTKTEGSIFNFILKANWYRGDYTNSLHNSYAMFRQPAKLVTISALIFFFQLINQKEKHKIIYFVGYLLSLVASILYLLCTDGRLQIAMFFGIQLIGFFLYRKGDTKLTKKQIALVGILGVAALLLITRLNDITSLIRFGHTYYSNEENNAFQTLMNEFGYVYESAQMSIEKTIFQGGHLFIFDDIVRGVFSILPSRFTPEGFELVWRYNTFVCTGSKLAGTIPCDLVSQSVYDLHIVGVAVIPLFWGFLARKVEDYYADKKSNSFNRAMYMGMVLIFFRIVNYCALYDCMRGFFAYLITFLLAYIVYKGAIALSGLRK